MSEANIKTFQFLVEGGKATAGPPITWGKGQH